MRSRRSCSRTVAAASTTLHPRALLELPVDAVQHVADHLSARSLFFWSVTCKQTRSVLEQLLGRIITRKLSDFKHLLEEGGALEDFETFGTFLEGQQFLDFSAFCCSDSNPCSSHGAITYGRFVGGRTAWASIRDDYLLLINLLKDRGEDQIGQDQIGQVTPDSLHSDSGHSDALPARDSAKKSQRRRVNRWRDLRALGRFACIGDCETAYVPAADFFFGYRLCPGCYDDANQRQKWRMTQVCDARAKFRSPKRVAGRGVGAGAGGSAPKEREKGHPLDTLFVYKHPSSSTAKINMLLSHQVTKAIQKIDKTLT